MDPVRMKTPAGAAASPTVGANYRRVDEKDAMGWLKLGPMDSGGSGEGGRAEEHTRCTQVQGPREEVKPLLLLVCLNMISV